MVSQPAQEPSDIPDPAEEQADLAALEDAPWQHDLLRPMLIAAVSSAFLLGPISLIHLVSQESRYFALLPFFILVTLQAVYTRLWLAKPQHRWYRDARTQLGEIALLLMILRALMWFIERQTFTQATLQNWLTNPGSFFDLPFIVSSILTIIGWRFAGSLALIFIDLGLSADELVDYQTLGRERGWMQAVPRDRQQLIARFNESWLIGGILLVFFAALSRVEFYPQPGQWLGLRTLGVSSELIIALLIYFFGGLILHSQARLAVLRARWQRERIPGIALVTAKWHRRAIILILGVGLVASLLPFGSSLGLAIILSALLRATLYLYFLFFALFALFLNLIYSLLGSKSPPPQPRPLEPIPTPAPHLPPPILPTLSLPDWAGGAVFWVLALLVVAYFLLAFLARRGILRLWDRAWWQKLQGWLQRLRRHTTTLLEKRHARLRLPTFLRDALPPSLEVARRFIRLRALTPTERTRYYYLSTLRRAAKQGVARQPHQTPNEYEPLLSKHLPEVTEDIHQLTQRFLQARYSALPITTEEEAAIRAFWQQIKRALIKRRRHHG